MYIFPTKSSQSQPLQIDMLTNTHALFKRNNAGTCIEHFHKILEFGCTPSYYICQIISVPIAPCPQFTCSNIMAVEVNILNLTWRIQEKHTWAYCNSQYVHATYFGKVSEKNWSFFCTFSVQSQDSLLCQMSALVACIDHYSSCTHL
jgi:hypothetical protein